MQCNKGNKTEAAEGVIYVNITPSYVFIKYVFFINILIVNFLLGNLGGNHMSFESVVRIIIIVVDKGLRIVGGFLL